MTRFLYIFLWVPLLLGSAFSALDDGVLKINQMVVSPVILEESPGAITVDYLMANLRSYEAEGALKKVWAVDLTGTYMSSDDFQTFMTRMMGRETLPSLRVLILRTVFLSDENWGPLLGSFLPHPSLEFVDVCNTHYSNSGIHPILRRGHALHSKWQEELSHKIVFAGSTYYSLLSTTIQWPKDAVAEGLLDAEWVTFHRQYYQGDHERVSRTVPLHFLTGDSDDDQQVLDDDSLEGQTSESRPSSVVSQLQGGE